MSVQLSREFEWVGKTPSFLALPVDRKLELCGAVTRCGTWDDLPEWVREFIDAARKEKPRDA